MEVFVRSRWQDNLEGKGYFWHPKEPLVAHDIESSSELVTDHSCTIAVWASYERGQHKIWRKTKIRYYLYLTGIDAGYSDNYNRPIKHTIVWGGGIDTIDQDERQMRSIMIQYLKGDLQVMIQKWIFPDKYAGFAYQKELEMFCNNLHDFNMAQDRSHGLIEYQDSSGVIEYLRKYKLPLESKLINNPTGLIVAFGSGFTKQRLQSHKHLKIVYNTDQNKKEA